MMISSKLMKGQGLYLASSAVSGIISPAKPLKKNKSRAFLIISHIYVTWPMIELRRYLHRRVLNNTNVCEKFSSLRCLIILFIWI